MNYSELFAGMKVVIWDWSEEYDDPPEHWDEEMDNYVGRIVTIAQVLKNGGVHIFEDDGNFMWDPNDFDYYECLPNSNPNIAFRRHAQKKEYNKMKEENKRLEFMNKLHKSNY